MIRHTILELYLSFLVTNGGHRFITGHSDASGGNRIAQQIAAFTNGWRSFQRLCHLPDCLPPTEGGRRVGEHEDGNGRWGLPKFALLQIPMILPMWDKVQDLIREGVSSFPCLVDDSDTLDVEIWRKWTPGIAESQCRAEGGALTPWSLVSHPDRPLKRLRVKGSAPRWRCQQFDFASWRKSWPANRPLQCKLDLPFADVHGLIYHEGAMSRREIHAIVLRWSNLARLAVKLHAHVCSDEAVRCHVVATVLSVRGHCCKCGVPGHMPIRNGWLKNSCTGTLPSTPVEIAASLLNEESQARLLASTLTSWLKLL